MIKASTYRVDVNARVFGCAIPSKRHDFLFEPSQPAWNDQSRRASRKKIHFQFQVVLDQDGGIASITGRLEYPESTSSDNENLFPPIQVVPNGLKTLEQGGKQIRGCL